MIIIIGVMKMDTLHHESYEGGYINFVSVLKVRSFAISVTKIPSPSGP